MSFVGTRSRSLPSTPPEFAAPGLATSLLKLHSALNQRDLWQALRTLAAEAISSSSLTLEIGFSDDGVPHKILRHAHPASARDLRRQAPDKAWLEERPGLPAYRLSDVVALRDVKETDYYEQVMRSEGWDKQLTVVGWHRRMRQGAMNFYRAPSQPDFSSRDLRLAEALQAHFAAALARVCAHDEAVLLGGHFADMLEAVPVGLLLLDWDLRPLWHNGEAAHVCAVWNYGESRAAAMRSGRSFRVPAPLTQACAELRARFQTAGDAATENPPAPEVLSEHVLGVHAQISLRSLARHALLKPAFHIQLDYRRPRGDRNRPLSPSAVVLLARLSGREREVAMRVREGLRNRQIAEELKRSPLTIKTQLTSIFSKLEVSSRAQAAALLNR